MSVVSWQTCTVGLQEKFSNKESHVEGKTWRSEVGWTTASGEVKLCCRRHSIISSKVMVLVWFKNPLVHAEPVWNLSIYFLVAGNGWFIGRCVVMALLHTSPWEPSSYPLPGWWPEKEKRPSQVQPSIFIRGRFLKSVHFSFKFNEIPTYSPLNVMI